MSYFGRFPYVLNYQIQGRKYTGMDITRKTGIVDKQELPASSYIEYTVKEGETPVILADRLYDDASMFWVIMMFNDMFDIDSDWPLDQIDLDRYVTRVYDDPYGVHHYQALSTGAWVDPDLYPEYDRIPITNYDYEVDLNDEKRYVKLPTPEYASLMVSQHNKAIRT